MSIYDETEYMLNDDDLNGLDKFLQENDKYLKDNGIEVKEEEEIIITEEDVELGSEEIMITANTIDQKDIVSIKEVKIEKLKERTVPLTKKSVETLYSSYGNITEFLKEYSVDLKLMEDEKEKMKVFDFLEEKVNNNEEKVASLYFECIDIFSLEEFAKRLNKMEDMQLYTIVGRPDLFIYLFEKDQEGFKATIVKALLGNKNKDEDTLEAIQDMLAEFVVDFAKETKKEEEVIKPIEDAIEISKEIAEKKKAEVKEEPKLRAQIGGYSKEKLKTGKLPGFD